MLLQAQVAELQASNQREQASLREAAASRTKLESMLQEQQAAAKAASGEQRTEQCTQQGSSAGRDDSGTLGWMAAHISW
jgi:hypothetical protein